MLNKLNHKFTEKIFENELDKSNTYRNECIIANKELMLKDEIDAGILLNAYSILNNKYEIKNFPNKAIGAYHLFRAAVAYDEKDFDTVIDETSKYMEVSLQREFIKEVSDMSNNRIVAFYILIKALLKKNRQIAAEEYLTKMKDYYDLLYIGKNISTDRVQAQQYTCLKWLEGKVKHSKLLECTKESEKVFVYGAGMITKKIFLKDSEMKSKIFAFIDLYYKPKVLQDIPVIKPEQMTNFEKIKTVVITVTHEFDSIKQELLKIRNDLNIISANDVFGKENNYENSCICSDKIK